jgi:hypothetical protein
MAGVPVDFTVEGELDAFDLGADPSQAIAILTAGCIPTEDAPQVWCEVRVESEEAPELTGESSFFHGGVRVRRTTHGWLMRDLRCWVEVDLREKKISAHIAPGRHHLAGFFRTTIFVAIVLQLRQFQRFHLHAGLVRRGEETLLIVGPSGSGKSTTTLSLRRAGFEALADDAVFLSAEGAFPIARPFHITGKTSNAFPEIARLGATDLGKFEANVARPSEVPQKPTGIVFLAGPQATTRITEVDAADALGLLIESSALVIVDGASEVEEHLQLLATLVAGTPCVRLEAGPEWLVQATDEALLQALAR